MSIEKQVKEAVKNVKLDQRSIQEIVTTTAQKVVEDTLQDLIRGALEEELEHRVDMGSITNELSHKIYSCMEEKINSIRVI